MRRISNSHRAKLRQPNPLNPLKGMYTCKLTFLEHRLPATTIATSPNLGQSSVPCFLKVTVLMTVGFTQFFPSISNCGGSSSFSLYVSLVSHCEVINCRLQRSALGPWYENDLGVVRTPSPWCKSKTGDQDHADLESLNQLPRALGKTFETRGVDVVAPELVVVSNLLSSRSPRVLDSWYACLSLSMRPMTSHYSPNWTACTAISESRLISSRLLDDLCCFYYKPST